MKTSKTINKLIIFLITLTVVSCTKDNPEPLIPISEKYDNGIFVTCEGNFNSANGSLSFISDDGVVENNIFNSVNGFPLGDVVQSITIIDTIAYIVVNNSGKVVVADAGTMQYISEIPVTTPDHMTAISNDVAYVSDWNAFSANGFVHVIDLKTNEITNSIQVGHQPGEILYSNGYVFVIESGVWPDAGNSISVINVESETVVENIIVETNPINMALNENVLWVLSKGETGYDENWQEISVTPGSLTSINTTSLQVNNVIELHEGKIPRGLVCNNNLLYFRNGQTIFSQSADASKLNAIEIITGNFNNEIINYNDHIYSAYVKSYHQSGEVYKFSSDGILENTFQVGIAPGNFGF